MHTCVLFWFLPYVCAADQELESERLKLMEEVTANKKKMKDLEDSLLLRLTTTQVSWDQS